MNPFAAFFAVTGGFSLSKLPVDVVPEPLADEVDATGM